MCVVDICSLKFYTTHLCLLTFVRHDIITNYVATVNNLITTPYSLQATNYPVYKLQCSFVHSKINEVSLSCCAIFPVYLPTISLSLSLLLSVFLSLSETTWLLMSEHPKQQEDPWNNYIHTYRCAISLMIPRTNWTSRIFLAMYRIHQWFINCWPC